MNEPTNVVLYRCDTCRVVRGYDVGFKPPEWGGMECDNVQFTSDGIGRCDGYLKPVNVLSHQL